MCKYHIWTGVVFYVDFEINNPLMNEQSFIAEQVL